jgi:hypothetical protein
MGLVRFARREAESYLAAFLEWVWFVSHKRGLSGLPSPRRAGGVAMEWVWFVSHNAR